MRYSFPRQKIIPISDARSQLSDLISGLDVNDSYVVTRRGRPEAVLVDYDFWQQFLKQREDFITQTFLDSRYTPFTRDFSDEEISQWQKEDQLT